MKWWKTFLLWFSGAVVLGLVLAAFSQEGSPSLKPDDKFKARIPPPPQLSADDLYGQLGRAHAQIEIQAKYISQLQQELTAAQALCQKPEETKEEK